MIHRTQNPFAQPAQLFQATLPLSLTQLESIEAALEDCCLSIATFERDEDAGRYEMQLIVDGEGHAELTRRLALLAQLHDLPEAAIVPVEQRDWVAQVQQNFPPIRAARFYVYGSHVMDPVPPASIPILMDAGAAFGTGEHETTASCLIMWDRIAKARRFERVLDMGCGSAILAIAAAKTQPLHADAVDIDAVSVEVARANVALNRVQSQVRLACGNGYDTPLVRGEYDLIFANILARPLMKMAVDLRRYLAADGLAILSGLLVRQERGVIMAHQAQGMKLEDRIRLGAWSCLLMRG